MTRLKFATEKAQALIAAVDHLRDDDGNTDEEGDGWSQAELEALETVETSLCNIIADAETAKINVQDDIAECLAAGDP